MKRLLLVLIAALTLAIPSLAEEGQVVVITAFCERVPARYEKVYFPKSYRPGRWEDMKVEDEKTKCRIVLKNIGTEIVTAYVSISSDFVETINYFPPGETVEVVGESIRAISPQHYNDIKIHTIRFSKKPGNSPYEDKGTASPPTRNSE